MEETEHFEGRSVDEEQRDDRARYWFNLLKIIACVACWLYLLKLAIPNAQAQEAPLTLSAKDAAGNIVRLTLEPCEGAPAWLGLRKAEMRYEGVDYLACWREVGGAVLVFDSNEDLTPIPAPAFSKDEVL